jgi:hypothetical protein
VVLPGLLAGATALDACLLQQLAVLLLGHPLATLLDYRTHDNDLPGDDNDDPGPTYLVRLTGEEVSLTVHRQRSETRCWRPLSPSGRSSGGGTR